MSRLEFAPPKVTVSVKLDLDYAVHKALEEAVATHNERYGEASLKVADAISEIVNEAVRKANGTGRTRRP
jgi:hypothetical protein